MKVLLFARARDLAGKHQIDVGSPEPANIGELRRRLAEEFPVMSSLLEKSVFAVDDEFADDLTPVSASSEVALLPPVSGG